MLTFKKLYKYLTCGEYRYNINCGHHIFDFLPDKIYLKMLYRDFFGKSLDLKNPETLCEKLQYLKLYDRNPLYTKMVDKYEAKEYISSIFGKEYITPTLGVWDNFDDIDFSKLPESFVLKCTHNSGYFSVCKNIKNFDKNSAKDILENGLKANYFYSQREWPYKNVKPRIIAEEYIPSLGRTDSIEYKVTCFNGKVEFVTICHGIAHDSFDNRFNDHFDKNFNPMPWYVNYKHYGGEMTKPGEWNDIIEFCEKVSAGIPYLRVDCYIIDGHIRFGEMTFYTWAGFMHFEPEEWDLILGKKLILPTIENKLE